MNLAVLEGTHGTVPEGKRETAKGLMLDFEFADAKYARLTAAGLPIKLELRNEDLGSAILLQLIPSGC